ncbi:MAG: RNA polymerase sigma factor [Vicinamibacterales bacterium]
MDLPILIARCKAGDELAWEAFVRQFQGRVYSLAGSYARSSDDARDMAQEIFVRLYEKRRAWPEADTFVPWMIRTARNLCIDLIRKAQVRPSAAESSEDDLARLTATAASPEDAFHLGTRKALLWRAVRRLSALNREIVVLKEIQGLSLEEVASLLKVPVGTVKSRSNRARLELAEKVLELSGRGAQPHAGGPGGA